MMNTNLSASAAVHAATRQPAAPKPPPSGQADDAELRQAFQSFVGQTLFGQMLKAMRKTVGKPAYFHGGQAEEIFRQQLDQVLAEKIADASAHKFSDPMYQLFVTKRR
ncbi:MAG: rod-binding protein [Planctomycetota bacterium]|jgi:Rod binding domain-containing protein